MFTPAVIFLMIANTMAASGAIFAATVVDDLVAARCGSRLRPPSGQPAAAPGAVVPADQRAVMRCLGDDLAGLVHNGSHRRLHVAYAQARNFWYD